MARVRQCDRLLRHMRDWGSITTLEAFTEYGIMRPASRIDELRKAGHPIKTRIEHGLNRYGEKTTYARYVLAGHEGDGLCGRIPRR